MKLETALKIVILILLVVIAFMGWELRQSWRNENFLDATINHPYQRK